jgi:hypothetical protein
MRFFVAEDVPQNDGGFLAAWETWRRFALGQVAVRAASEKRWQSHRTPKVLGGGGLGEKEILRRGRRSSG